MSSPLETSEKQGERKPASAPEQDQLRASSTPGQTPAERAVVAEIAQRAAEERQRELNKGRIDETFTECSRQLKHYLDGAKPQHDPPPPIPENVLEKSMQVMNKRMDKEKLNLSPDELNTVKEFERAVLSGDLEKLREFGKSAPKPSVLETIRRDFHQIGMDVDWRSGYTAVFSEYNNTYPVLSLFPASPEPNPSPAAHLGYPSQRAMDAIEPFSGDGFLHNDRNGLGWRIHNLSNYGVVAREIALIANARLSRLNRR